MPVATDCEAYSCTITPIESHRESSSMPTSSNCSLFPSDSHPTRSRPEPDIEPVRKRFKKCDNDLGDLTSLAWLQDRNLITNICGSIDQTTKTPSLPIKTETGSGRSTITTATTAATTTNTTSIINKPIINSIICSNNNENIRHGSFDPIQWKKRLLRRCTDCCLHSGHYVNGTVTGGPGIHRIFLQRKPVVHRWHVISS